MSDSRFDHVYDPVATPNPAYDDDFEPAPAPSGSWERRSLAQALLTHARKRQDAIAGAFVDAMLAGKISLFRLLLDLEQAAIAAEAEAQQARMPSLADVLLPMLDRERKQAAAAAETAAAPEPAPARPALVAPAPNPPQSPAPPQPGVTDVNAAAEPGPSTAPSAPPATPSATPAASRPCRTRARARKPQPRTPHRPGHNPVSSARNHPPLETLHAARQPQPAPRDSSTPTIPSVSPPRRRKRTPLRTTHSKQISSVPNAS